MTRKESAMQSQLSRKKRSKQRSRGDTAQAASGSFGDDGHAPQAEKQSAQLTFDWYDARDTTPVAIDDARKAKKADQ